MRTKKQSNGDVNSSACRIALVDGDAAAHATMRAAIGGSSADLDSGPQLPDRRLLHSTFRGGA